MRQIFLSSKKNNSKTIIEIYATSIEKRMKNLLLQQFQASEYEIEQLQTQLIKFYNQLSLDEICLLDQTEVQKCLIQTMNLVDQNMVVRSYFSQDFYENQLIPIIQRLFLYYINDTSFIQILTVIILKIIKIGWHHNKINVFKDLVKNTINTTQIRPYLYLIFGKYARYSDDELELHDLITATKYLVKQHEFIQQIQTCQKEGNYGNQSPIPFEFEYYLESNADLMESDLIDYELKYQFTYEYLKSEIKLPIFQNYLYKMLVEVVMSKEWDKYPEWIPTIVDKVQFMTQYIYEEFIVGRYYFSVYEREFFFLLKLVEAVVQYQQYKQCNIEKFQVIQEYLEVVAVQCQQMLSIIPDNTYSQSAIISFLLFQQKLNSKLSKDFIMINLRKYHSKPKIIYKILQFLFDYESDLIVNMSTDDIDFLATIYQSTNQETMLIQSIIELWGTSDKTKLQYLIDQNYIINPQSDCIPIPTLQQIQL